MAVAIDQPPKELLLENWGGDDPEEALERAERAPSSTPKDQMKRCPNCGGFRVILKPGTIQNIPHRKQSKYKCPREGCYSHFDTPARSIAEVREELPERLERAVDRAGKLAAVLGGEGQ